MKCGDFEWGTFKDLLFDEIQDHFDVLDESDVDVKTSQDFQILKALSLQAANPESRVQDIVRDIGEYVERGGKEHVCSLLQGFYECILPIRALQTSASLSHKIRLQIETMSVDAYPKDELILLSMHVYSRTQSYNGYLVNADRFEDSEGVSVPALYQRIDNIIEKDHSSQQRIQIIARQKEHYTAIDIHKGSRACLVLDAANDLKAFNLYDLSKNSSFIDKVYYIKVQEFPAPKSPKGKKDTRLQKDSCSCSTFALDHSFQAASDDGIFSWLETNAIEDAVPGRYYLSWTQFKPCMVRNAQSDSFLDLYAENNPDEAEIVSQYRSKQGLQQTNQRIRTEVSGLLEQHDDLTLASMIKQTSSYAQRTYAQNMFRLWQHLHVDVADDTECLIQQP